MGTFQSTIQFILLFLQKDTYQKVVNDVIDGVREAFVDEGSDEQVLLELKQV